MYSKQEASRLKQEFWTSFGQYMNPIPSAEGESINWINYKTGEKDLTFRMETDNKKGRIGIVLSHKDPGIQQLYFEQLVQFKNILHHALNELWIWEELVFNAEGKMISRVYKECPGVNVFRKEDWPSLISFFKPRIIALDEFWSNVKYAFASLK